MTSTKATPENLFPAAALAPRTERVTPPSFTAPAAVEFPEVVDPSGTNPVSVFGSKVQTDQDPHHFDTNISHVRDVHYQPVATSPIPLAAATQPATRPATEPTPSAASERVVARKPWWSVSRLLWKLLILTVLLAVAAAAFLTR